MTENTLFQLSQNRDSGALQDSKFMTAETKQKVLKHWKAFLESGLQKDKFTELLYEHLIQHCMFIAHYDIHGFYSTYFENGDDTIQFLSQFDGRQGMPKSVEYGLTYWLTGENYYDINSEMVRIAGKYIPSLLETGEISQRVHDIDLARALLAKHGRSLP